MIVGAVVLDHLAIAPEARDFRFGEMGEDLRDRPFVGSGTLGKLLARCAFHQPGQLCRSLALHRNRVFAFHQAQDPVFVLFGRFVCHVLPFSDIHQLMTDAGNMFVYRRRQSQYNVAHSLG